jgi:hypothetical protein
MTSNEVVGLVFVALLVWLFYMMTFRTDDFLRLWEANQKAKRETFHTIGKVAKPTFGLLSWWLTRRR